jgi:alpha-galactosidase
LNEPLYAHAGPGHWNDPDMLQVGNGGMTDVEERSHFSLWAIMAAPLLAGNDIANMDARVRDILLNKEVIAVDQDRMGIQGHRVRDDGDLEVWSKPLADGGRAVVLFNRGPQSAEIAAKWTELGYPSKMSAEIRDLWAHKSLGRKAGGFSATVPSHGVVMVRVTP